MWPMFCSRSLRMHALIAEDDPSIRALVQTVVKREGFDVDLASDGEAAIERLENRCYDLVLLDLMMPGMDGYAVVRQVKERWPARLPRIIIMTALTEAIKNDFPEAVCGVLSKPFDIDKLSALVHDCARGCGQP